MFYCLLPKLLDIYTLVFFIIYQNLFFLFTCNKSLYIVMSLLKNLTQLNWVNIQIIVKRCDQGGVLPLLITYEVLWLQTKNKVGLGFE